MKLSVSVLGILLFLGLFFAADPSTCADCDEFNDAAQGRILTSLDSAGTTLQITTYYENYSEPIPRVAINNTAIIIELTNASGHVDAYFPSLYKVYTNAAGTATFNFSQWATEGCFNMKVLYCPFCTEESAACGFAECLEFSDIHSEAGYYINAIPDETAEIIDITNIENAPGSATPATVNTGTYLPEVTVVSYCAPETDSATTPAFCLPLVIIFALLSGALYLTGQNPFGVFNLGNPRTGKHIRYQARGRGFSFAIMSVVQAASSVAGTIGDVKDAKKEAKKEYDKKVNAAKAEGKSTDDIKKPTTRSAIRSVETNRASGSVFLVSGAHRVFNKKDGTIKTTRESIAAMRKEGMGDKSLMGTMGRGLKMMEAYENMRGSQGAFYAGKDLVVGAPRGQGQNFMIASMRRQMSKEGIARYVGIIGVGLTNILLVTIKNHPIYYSYAAMAQLTGRTTDVVKFIDNIGRGDIEKAREESRGLRTSDGSVRVKGKNGEELYIWANGDVIEDGLTSPLRQVQITPATVDPNRPPAQQNAEVTYTSQNMVATVSYTIPSSVGPNGAEIPERKVTEVVSRTDPNERRVIIETRGTKPKREEYVYRRQVDDRGNETITIVNANRSQATDDQRSIAINAVYGRVGPQSSTGEVRVTTVDINPVTNMPRINPETGAMVPGGEYISRSDGTVVKCQTTSAPASEKEAQAALKAARGREVGEDGVTKVTIAKGPNAGTYGINSDGTIVKYQETTVAVSQEEARLVTDIRNSRVSIEQINERIIQIDNSRNSETPNRGTYILNEDGSVGRYSVDSPAEGAQRTMPPTQVPEPASKSQADAVLRMEGGVVDEAGVRRITIETGPNAGNYGVNNDGTVVRYHDRTVIARGDISEAQATSIMTLIQPIISGETPGGCIPGETPRMTPDILSGEGRRPLLGRDAQPASLFDTFENALLRVADADDNLSNQTLLAQQHLVREIRNSIGREEAREIVAGRLEGDAVHAVRVALGEDMTGNGGGALDVVRSASVAIQNSDIMHANFAQDAVRTSWDSHSPAPNKAHTEALDSTITVVARLIETSTFSELEGQTGEGIRTRVRSLIEDQMNGARTNPTLTSKERERLEEGLERQLSALDRIDFDRIAGNIHAGVSQTREQFAANMGTERAERVLSATPAQFAYLAETANLTFEYTRDPRENIGEEGTTIRAKRADVVEMIIRDPTLARSEETRELIGEYLAYDIGRTELDRVASQARAGVYTRDQYERIDPVTGERTGYTRAIDEVNRGTGIEGYRTTVEEVEAVGRAHRNDIPPEYDRMIESYRQGYGQQAVADAMRLRLEEGFGRLAEPSFGEAAINHAEGVNIRMYVFLQPPPVESDQAAPSPGTAEPTQSWRIPEENYNIVKTDLVNESRRYHRLGMDEVANGYAEALTCVNNASRATDMATQNEEIAKAQQIIERLTTTVAQGDEGLNGVIYNAVQTAEQQMRTERAEGDAKVHRAVEYGEQVYRRAETRFGPIEEWERVSPRPTDTAGGDSGTQPPPSEPPPGSQPETPPEEPGEGRRKRPRKEVEKTLDEIVQDEIEEHETEEARKRRGKR